MTGLVANYDRHSHLVKLHLNPGEQCNSEKKSMTDAVECVTREEALAAILSVSKLDQLCIFCFGAES